jgi:hypothetical protein
MIGQVLPNVTEYNFKGSLDDIAIYDYALSLEEIAELYSVTSRNRENGSELPVSIHLSQNYPNPFNPTTTLQFDIPRGSHVTLEIYDINGRLIETLVDEYKSAGSYFHIWNSPNISSGVYMYRLQTDELTLVKKCVKLK